MIHYVNTISRQDEDGRVEWDAEVVYDIDILVARLDAMADYWEGRGNEIQADTNLGTWHISQERASIYLAIAKSVKSAIAPYQGASDAKAVHTTGRGDTPTGENASVISGVEPEKC